MEYYDVAQLIVHAGAKAGPYALRPRGRLMRGPAGLLPGSDSGTSIDFYDYRSYQPGDDLRRVDWRVYARSDQLVIRRFRAEIAPVIDILLDNSASMGLYAGKSAAASYVAAFLAETGRNSRGRPVLIYNNRRFSGNDFEPGLGAARFDLADDMMGQPVPPPSCARSLRVVIGDFLSPHHPDHFWSSLAIDSAGLIVVHILADSERVPNCYGGFKFIDVENALQHKDIRVNGSTIQGYQDRLNAHLIELDETWKRLGATVIRLDVNDSFTGLDQTGNSIIAALIAREVITRS